MAPKSFSQDGAAGAWGGDGASGSAIGPDIVNDFGGSNTVGATSAFSGASPAGGPQIDYLGGTSGAGFQGTSSNRLGGGFSFADGGAVDTSDDGSQDQDMMAKALESVDKTLQYTYQKYGLGGGDQESGGQQQAGAMPMIPGNQSETPGPYVPQQPKPQQDAAAMPMIPGNQSETPGPYVPQQPKPQQMAANMPTVPGSQSNSGIPPQQPMPGPLPPTSNPFGKRSDNGSGSDENDQTGAIDTETA